MNYLDIELSQVANSQNVLSTAKAQLSLLNRLLSENSSLLDFDSEEKAEINSELATVFSLTHVVSQKVDLLYRRTSLKLQV